MTERWERELEKLRAVAAPPGVRDRVYEGPRGTTGPGPSRGQRVLAGVVAFAFFGAALALAAGALGDRPAPVVDDPSDVPGKDVAVMRLRATPDEPVGTLTYGDSTIQGSYGGYCREQPYADSGVEGCVIAERGPWNDTDYLHIPEGTQFVFDADVEAEAIGISVGPGDALSADGPAVDLASLSTLGLGSHVVSVTVPWPQGVVEFDFPILIVERQPESEPSAEPGGEVVLTLQGGNAPSATLTYGGVEAPSQVASYCWNQPREDGVVVNSCADTVLTPFDPGELLQIPSGVAVRIDVSDDVSGIEFVVRVGLDPAGGEVPGMEISPLGPGSDAGRWPLEPGVYVVTALTNWRGQDERIDFHFGIQVVDNWGPPIELIAVPDLVGAAHQDASQLLEDLGLKYAWAFREVPGVELGHVASTDPPAGTLLAPGEQALLVIATEITPLSDGSDALDCAEDRYVAFGGPDARDEPGGEAYIRVNLGGIFLTDEVIQVSSTDPEMEWHGIWHVVRDGLVIAVVDWETLDGVACQGSGVAGA